MRFIRDSIAASRQAESLCEPFDRQVLGDSLAESSPICVLVKRNQQSSNAVKDFGKENVDAANVGWDQSHPAMQKPSNTLPTILHGVAPSGPSLSSISRPLPVPAGHSAAETGSYFRREPVASCAT